MNDLASPEQLLSRIVAIFPEFESYWEVDYPGEASRQQTAHAVYMSLFPFVHSMTPSARQLSRFSALFNDAVAAGGVSENAVGTCFLEHFGTSPLRAALGTMLLPAAKKRLRA